MFKVLTFTEATVIYPSESIFDFGVWNVQLKYHEQCYKFWLYSMIAFQKSLQYRLQCTENMSISLHRYNSLLHLWNSKQYRKKRPKDSQVKTKFISPSLAEMSILLGAVCVTCILCGYKRALGGASWCLVQKLLNDIDF